MFERLPPGLKIKVHVHLPARARTFRWGELMEDYFVREDVFKTEMVICDEASEAIASCDVVGQIEVASCIIRPSSSEVLYREAHASQTNRGLTMEQLFQRWVARVIVRLCFVLRSRHINQPYIRVMRVSVDPLCSFAVPFHGLSAPSSLLPHLGNCTHPHTKQCRCLWVSSISLGTMLNRGTVVQYYSATRNRNRLRLDARFIHDEEKFNITIGTGHRNDNEMKHKFEFKYESVERVLVDPTAYINQVSMAKEMCDANENVKQKTTANVHVVFLLKHPARVFKTQEVKVEPTVQSCNDVDEVSDEDVAQPSVAPTDPKVKPVKFLTTRVDHIDDPENYILTREVLANSEALVLSLPIEDMVKNDDDANSTQFLGLRSRDRFFELVGRLRSLLGETKIMFTSLKLETENPPEMPLPPIIIPMYHNVAYAITALLSLGFRTIRKMGRTRGERAHVISHIEKKAISAHGTSDVAAENVLWQMFYALYGNEIFEILPTFDRLFEEEIHLPFLFNEDLSFGNQTCKSVYKVIITPTRTILLQKETIMGNRVLDQEDENDFIRVQFKEEDFQVLRLQLGGHDVGHERMVKEAVRKIMVPEEGKELQIGDKKFRLLAWSNSQVKDRGFYMSCKKDDFGNVYGPRQLADKLGTFKEDTENLPKVLSRMAQCLTQARPSIEITKGVEAKREDDFEGGWNPESKAKFCFSDGVGLISLEKAQLVAKDIMREDDERNYVPSALQIRWAGVKGMLTVDPKLPLLYKGDVHMIYRDSMLKFNGTKETLEIAKPSKPGEVALNHRLVMILDQVSKKQSVQCHQRICKAIHGLVERQLFALGDMLFSEKKAIERMENDSINNPMCIKYDKISRDMNIKLSIDPFFRNQLLAVHKQALKLQANKCQIPLPMKWGRNMFGVVDYTGYLQPDEVFVQISASAETPQTVEIREVARRASILAITGRVMVLKNPCMESGDVRMLHAVKAPPLEHLVDVIVFSRWGNRPNPDQMAGSDLDGDEYGVIFESACPDLMLDHNEVPMDFPCANADKAPFILDETHIYNFFIKNLQAEAMGRIANAHLVHADRFGLMSQEEDVRVILDSLARKYSQALDFPKTGVAPEPLDKEEQVFQYPDYKCKVDKPWYKSDWILGELFRKSNQVKMLAEACEKGRKVEELTLDALMLRETRIEYMDMAFKTRDEFFNQVQRIMDMYGITDEAGLFCGKVDIDPSRRVASSEVEDFNLFSTDVFIKKAVRRLVEAYRKNFFIQLEDIPQSLNGEDLTPSLKQMDLASAYYEVTYNPKLNKSTKRSFPWLVWDVLQHVRRQNCFDTVKGERKDFGFSDPILKYLQDDLKTVTKKLSDAYISERAFINKQTFAEPYIKVYGKQLECVFTVFVRWAVREGLVSDMEIKKQAKVTKGVSGRPEWILALLIDWACNNTVDENLWGGDAMMASALTVNTMMARGLQTTTVTQEIVQRLTSIRDMTTFWSEKIVLGFLKYLASDTFYRQDNIQFQCVSACLWHKELTSLHRAAFVAYHKMTLECKLNSLIPDVKEDNNWDMEEGQAQRVLIDWGYDTPKIESEIMDLMKEWSGVDQLTIRQHTRLAKKESNPAKKLYLVVARGSGKSRHKLQNILVHPKLTRALVQRQKPTVVVDQW